MDITKNNYYKILNIDKKCNTDEILSAYEFNISKFNNLPFLTENQQNEIKDIKIAKYILSNKKIKDKYDLLLEKKKDISSTAICDRIFSL